MSEPKEYSETLQEEEIDTEDVEDVYAILLEHYNDLIREEGCNHDTDIV